MAHSGGVSRTTIADLGALRAGLAPVAGTGSAQNGAWVDRTNAFSVVVPFAYQTAGGASGGTITVQLQDATSAAGAGAANFLTAATITVPAGPNAGDVLEFTRNLEGARQFIRVVVTSIPTGGTPTSVVSAPIQLSSFNKFPAV